MYNAHGNRVANKLGLNPADTDATIKFLAAEALRSVGLGNCILPEMTSRRCFRILRNAWFDNGYVFLPQSHSRPAVTCVWL